ncbi:MAG: MmgE/PrpD family protein [Fimbriimonadaceae bacterium]|nr:MmgE/PrpD family protein [Fimbriimonadaceae bacterium]
MSNAVTLGRDTNQALGLGRFAVEFVSADMGSGPSEAVLARTQLFHTDSVVCGVSALALGTNAPCVLRNEALGYVDFEGATVFGSKIRVRPEKAIVANSAAVREWDSNGTNFGYRPEMGHTAGEFGHNDFYPVVIAACQQRRLDGATALRAMVLLDEIRGRLAEVFSLKSYKIDHVVHGAIASAAVYGALMGAGPEEIESAIGMYVAHYVPWRAIRAGKQLSDSKGASAAIAAEAAVLCVHRSMAGFRGPRDIFRNPEALFRFFEPTTAGDERWKEQGDSPFDLVLSQSGDDFAVMGMHFKLGLYEHQSAGALQAVITALAAHPALLADPGGGGVASIEITAYEPAYGIIGNPAKMDPKTRQSADHSMAYIVATLLRKALDLGRLPKGGGSDGEAWKALMLTPWDYKENESAVFHPLTRSLMQKVAFRHGGADYDAKYPEGIPTSVVLTGADGTQVESGLVMFPAGHARNLDADLKGILAHKFEILGALAWPDAGVRAEALARLGAVGSASAEDVRALYATPYTCVSGYE